MNSVFNEIKDGAGNELKEKFLAIHSSSALVVNNFGFWKNNPTKFKFLGKTDFKTMNFETKKPTGLRGTSPHFDIYLQNHSDIFAIESKFTEILKKGIQKFSDSYNKSNLNNAEDFIFHLIEYYSEKKMYFGAAQIIKHYLGLINNNHDELNMNLVYLYWTTTDHNNYDEYKIHFEEVEYFKERFQSKKVTFTALSYIEYWSGLIDLFPDRAFEIQRRYLI